MLVLPPIAYWLTYRLCLGLQRSDRDVLEHGIDTGLTRRLPNGGFVSVHQPLGAPDADGRPTVLTYQGAPVPQRMNQLGVAGAPVPGSFLTPDPRAETVAREPTVGEPSWSPSSDIVRKTRTVDGQRIVAGDRGSHRVGRKLPPRRGWPRRTGGRKARER